MIFRRKTSIFLKIINYLNRQSIGYKYTANDIASKIRVKELSVHFYSEQFSILGFIEITKLSNKTDYKLLKHFPHTLNTTILNEIVYEIICYETWENWFIEIEDRIQMKYNERYGNETEKI